MDSKRSRISEKLEKGSSNTSGLTLTLVQQIEQGSEAGGWFATGETEVLADVGGGAQSGDRSSQIGGRQKIEEFAFDWAAAMRVTISTDREG